MLVSQKIQSRLDALWTKLQKNLITPRINQFDLDEKCAAFLEKVVKQEFDNLHKDAAVEASTK